MPEAPKKTCFIAMPVSTLEEHASIYGDPKHWDHVLSDLMIPAVEAAGFDAWPPVTDGSNMIHAEIVRQLGEADMVLCDMSQHNPNVFFELGVRTSYNKPIALVKCNTTGKIPFDVSGVNTHTYDPSLKSFVMDEQIDKLAKHLLAAERSCAGTNPFWKQYGLELTAEVPSADASAQEAQMTLVLSRLDDLGRQVGDMARRPIRLGESAGRFGTPRVVSDEEYESFNDALSNADRAILLDNHAIEANLQKIVEEHANASGLPVKIMVRTKDRKVHVHVLSPANASTADVIDECLKRIEHDLQLLGYQGVYSFGT